MNYEFPIPSIYLELTYEYTDREKRKEKFHQYVRGYIEKSYPEFELDTTKGMKAICRKRGNEVENRG